MSTTLDVLHEHGFGWPAPSPAEAQRRTVMRFQRAWAGDVRRPLVVDGILGPKTRAAARQLPRLSLHFTVYELWDGREHDCGIRRELVWALEALRSHLGRPLVIRSGYRTLSTNTLVGGARASLHMQGCAVDLATTVYDAEVRPLGLFSGVGVKWAGSRARALHLDVRHVLGKDNPTPGATTKRPARWSY